MVKILDWLKEFYDLEGVLTPLDGYADQNYRLSTTEGTEFIVKLSFDLSEYSLIQAQNELLTYLTNTDDSRLYPGVIHSVKGNMIERVEDPGINLNKGKGIIRILTWLEGHLLKDVEHTPDLFMNMGATLGRLNKSLQAFQSHPIQSRISDWDLQHALITSPNTPYIAKAENRRIVEYYFLQFENFVRPVLGSMRKSLIHADANDYNVLVNDNKISGIIDFGDCVYSQTINELAIALAYALMGKNDPVEWACHVVRSYNAEFPLEKEEIEVLYYLIATRLAISVTKAAVSRLKDPENKYLQVSESQATDLLKKMIEINPGRFSSALKEACSYPIEEGTLASGLLADREKHISPSLSISYREPVTMQRAALQYMYSADGKTYLDCVNNIMHVGHCHPRVVRAGQNQMAVMNTNTRYLYGLLNEYAEKLTEKFPAPLDTVFFVNSGSEAGDLAQRIARTITGSINTIVVDHAYHGNTIAGIEVSPYKYNGPGGPGRAPHIFKMEIPDGYRGKYRYSDPGAGVKYATQIDGILEEIASGGLGVAAFYCESIIGCGGQVILPQGYLKSIYKKVRNAGGLCIADEVQVGFGRVGEKFWGFELQEVVPDMVVLGKPMGNGHPVASVVTTRDIADKFNNGMEYFSSFGGNPVSCAIGMEVLRVIEDEKLQQNASDTGAYFKEQLQSLQSTHEVIGDVRGYGLFLGIELVTDRETRAPATKEAKKIIEEMKDRNILLSTDGPYNNVIKIKPPLVFNKANVNTVISNLDEVLTKRSK